MLTNTATESAQPRKNWIVTSITYSERSGLMIRGVNLYNTEYKDKGFSWDMPAKDFAADLARETSEYDIDYAVIDHPRAARLCEFYGIKIPCAVGVTPMVFA